MRYAALLLVFLVAAPASAQEADEKWLVGTWQGVTASPAGGDDKREVVFQPNGKFSSDTQSVRGGLVTAQGTYKVEGQEVIATGTLSGNSAVHGRPIVYKLKRNGDVLQGVIESTRTFDVVLKRVK